MMALEPRHVYVLARKVDKYDGITSDMNARVNRLGSAPSALVGSCVLEMYFAQSADPVSVDIE